MREFSIAYFGDVVPRFYNGDAFVTADEDRLSYETYELATLAMAAMAAETGLTAEEERLYMVVPNTSFTLVPPAQMLPALPPPDFYESENYQTAENILSIITQSHWERSFTFVDNITGAGQACAGVVVDERDTTVKARKLAFSFTGYIKGPEFSLLQEAALRGKKWTDIRIAMRGNGATGWFIITLYSDIA